jgi:hypothetical protein
MKGVNWVRETTSLGDSNGQPKRHQEMQEQISIISYVPSI